ncbi:hypothetical protein KBB89_03490 [Candidatus Gracilibacteria bacterium]|nr:hypothetical protein [Candidatus Gracilibacteria bacterium]
MNPEELLKEAEDLGERASSLIFEDGRDNHNEAVSCVFLMRQRVLDTLGEFDDAPNWVYDLETECSEQDMYFLSCAVHRLVTGKDMGAVIDALTRYKSILKRVSGYMDHTKKKLPAVRGFGSSSSELVTRYENMPLNAMQPDVTNFLIDIHTSKKLWSDSVTSREAQRTIVMDLIMIRESLHSIFTKIWTDCSIDDEELDDILRDFNGACVHSVHDVPLLIEEVESGDVDGSISSFIDFLQVVAERIVDFFETGDYGVFRGVTFIVSEYSEELEEGEE